jgi:hypothetical protein
MHLRHERVLLIAPPRDFVNAACELVLYARALEYCVCACESFRSSERKGERRGVWRRERREGTNRKEQEGLVRRRREEGERGEKDVGEGGYVQEKLLGRVNA